MVTGEGLRKKKLWGNRGMHGKENCQDSVQVGVATGQPSSMKQFEGKTAHRPLLIFTQAGGQRDVHIT